MEDFNRQLAESGFTDQEIDQLIEAAQLLELPTRHVLLKQGEVAQHIFF